MKPETVMKQNSRPLWAAIQNGLYGGSLNERSLPREKW